MKANNNPAYLKDVHYSKKVNSLWSDKSMNFGRWTELTLNTPPLPTYSKGQLIKSYGDSNIRSTNEWALQLNNKMQ